MNIGMESGSRRALEDIDKKKGPDAANKANRRGKLALKLLFYNWNFYLLHPGRLWRRAARFLGF